jgi:hypothetical protein
MLLISFVQKKNQMARNTKLDYLTGTARRLFTPFLPSSTKTSSVYGFSH